MRTLKALRAGICMLALTGCSVTMGTATPLGVFPREGNMQIQECKLTISNYFLIEYARIHSCHKRVIKLPE